MSDIKGEYLDGLYLSVAAGQHTTLFLAKPNEQFSDLPRHPEVDAPEFCLVCDKDNGDEDPALECDKVRSSLRLVLLA